MSHVEQLIKGETTAIMKGFQKKDGKTFDAALRYNNGKVEFVFPKNDIIGH